MSTHDRAREPKSCRPCAQAKVKCEPQSVDGCKRCLRLKRECIMQAPGAHKRKVPKPSDVARLEQKLDSMAAIFTESSKRLCGANIGGGSGHPIQVQSPPRSVPPCDEDIMLSDEEALLRLETFRTEMTPYFPFVNVPTEFTVSELRQKKPFLLRAIVMVTCLEDANRQLAMAKNIRECISTSIVVKGEQSLDLLQGLLVCLAWFHLQLQLGTHIYRLIHLALGMLIELGLDRRSAPAGKMGPMINHLVRRGNPHTHRTLEERRVYLGLFYINSITAMCRRDMDPMKYTDYTEECCRVLEDAGEHPTDLYLVRLVRLHRMAGRIRRMLTIDEYDSPGLILSAPIGMCIKSIEAELRQLKQSLGLNSVPDPILLLHYYAVELSLYEIALEDDFPAKRYGDYPLTRLNILYSCLTVTKAFFDTFFLVPTRQYFNLPHSVHLAFSHALGILSKLLVFTGENWDQEYVRSIIDFPVVTNTLVSRIQKAVEVSHLEQPPYRVPEMFVRLIPRVHVFEEIHEARRAALMERGGDIASDDISLTAAGDFIPDMIFPLPDDLLAIFTF
ncbi:hypothetical protein V1525DRAFT_414898 [Lipomyces kononenkoae]|uniref:Uncharacterized protein n=1 Tax=Lipomyces kononenkoae TaxID=34357 RepID=A0ACC3SQF4_LIPKO